MPLYIVLGAVLQTAQGHAAPEVEQAYTEAYTLCQQVGEPPDFVPVLMGLWRVYLMRPQMDTARKLGETLLRLAQQAHDPVLAVTAHYALGVTWFFLGVLSAARLHLEEGIARYTPEQRRAPVFRMGHDPGVGYRIYTAMTLWLLGYPAQALAHLHDGLVLAHELSHPYSLAAARCLAAFVSSFAATCRPCTSRQRPPSGSRRSRDFHSGRPGERACVGGRWPCRTRARKAMAQLRQGIAAWRATGAALCVPYFCLMLAEVSAQLGRLEDGLQMLVEAHTLVEQQEERLWEAEIYRLRGVVLLRQTMPQEAEAEAWLQRALDVARRQEAKALELRAAMSLAHLWQQQGKRAKACELLAPIYGWFTEGFDTADLQEAKALLEELGE